MQKIFKVYKVPLNQVKLDLAKGLRKLGALNILKRVFGEKWYSDSLIRSRRYESICISFHEKVLIIKDRETGQIIEIGLRSIGSKEWRLSCNCKCCKCESGDCDHIIFAMYSPHVSILRDLYFECEIQILQLPLRIYRRISKRLSFDLMRLVPGIVWLIIGMGLMPMVYDPAIDSYRIFLSGLLGLSPLVPTGVLI